MPLEPVEVVVRGVRGRERKRPSLVTPDPSKAEVETLTLARTRTVPSPTSSATTTPKPVPSVVGAPVSVPVIRREPRPQTERRGRPKGGRCVLETG